MKHKLFKQLSITSQYLFAKINEDNFVLNYSYIPHRFLNTSFNFYHARALNPQPNLLFITKQKDGLGI